MEWFELVENGDCLIYESGECGVVYNFLEDLDFIIIVINVKFEFSEDILLVVKELVVYFDDSV